MASFAIGQTIKTREPAITVDPGLDPGRHRFRLEVVRQDGRTSVPDEIVVEISRSLLTTDSTVDPQVTTRSTRPVRRRAPRSKS